MPKWTLYIKDEDMGMVEKAKEILKRDRRSLSAQVMLLLEGWVKKADVDRETSYRNILAGMRRDRMAAYKKLCDESDGEISYDEGEEFVLDEIVEGERAFAAAMAGYHTYAEYLAFENGEDIGVDEDPDEDIDCSILEVS